MRRPIVLAAAFIVATAAGCAREAYWQGVKVTAVTRHADGTVAVPDAQVRLLEPSAGVCSLPRRIDNEHWFGLYGRRTDGDGDARFQMWRCERVRAVVSKVGFEPALADVDSCDAKPLKYATVTVELAPRRAAPAARGPGIAAVAFVEALAQDRWNDAMALTAAAGGDLEDAPPIVTPLRRPYEAESMATVAEQVSMDERGAGAAVCVRLVHSDGCIVPFEVTNCGR